MKKQQGFTLIELLLTLGLLAISVGVTTDIIISITKSYNKTEMANELEQNSNYVLLKMEKELRNASSITVPTAAVPISSTLTFLDRSGSTITYNVASGVLSRKVGAAALTPIVNTDPTVGVYVECLSGCFTLRNTSPQVIQLGLRFKQKNNAFTGVVDLNTTIVLRGTY